MLFRSLLDLVPTKEWKFWEKYYISLFKSWGFKLENKNEGGGGVTHHNIETKKIISSIHKGLSKPMSENTKHKISQIHKNERILTKKWKENISKGLKGRIFDEEWRKNLSLNAKNSKGKPVIQYDLYGNFIKEFINTAEAEEYIRKDKNRKSRNIGDCCLGKQKMAYGYKWKFK